MSERTAIEWTDHTFNIAWGCMKVSPGCTHCYADTLSRRYGHDVWGPAKTTPRRTFGAKHWGDPAKWDAAAKRDGVRRRVFCGSMCDVFEDHPTIDAEREKLWPIVRATPNLDWQLLTKRPERIAANLPTDWGEGYPNVWLGTSVESQEYADQRIPHLVAVPAVVRFLSCEPLLGPVEIDFDDIGSRDWEGRYIDWVIVGGESGAGARACDVQWIRELLAECAFGGVPCFVKQLGAHPCFRLEDEEARGNIMPSFHHSHGDLFCKKLTDAKGGDLAEWPEDLRVRQFPGEVVA